METRSQNAVAMERIDAYLNPGFYDQSTIAAEIRQWREDVALVSTPQSAPRSRTAMLVYGWNWATSTTALRSDREHKACRRFARWCMSRLQGRPGWHEMESGRLWV